MNNITLEAANNKKLQKFINDFTFITSFSANLFDYPSNKVILYSKWNDICKKFYRKNAASNKVCETRNKAIFESLKNKKDLYIDVCPSGIVSGFSPVLVNGEHVATVSMGCVLFENPNLELFREQAEKYGYDIDSFLTEIEQLPVVEEAKFRSCLIMLTNYVKKILEKDLLEKDINKKELEIITASSGIKSKEEESIFNDEYLDTFVNNFDGHFFICSQDYKIVRANNNFIEKYGYNYQQSKCFEYIYNNKDICPWCEMENVFNKNKMYFKERFDPVTNCWYFIGFAPVMLLDNKKYCIVFLNDITKTKENEKEIKEKSLKNEYIIKLLEKKFKTALRDKDFETIDRQTINLYINCILNSISYSLRTPLNTIIGFSELLRKEKFGDLNDKQVEFIDYIYNDGQNLLSITNDIMAIIKFDAGLLEFNIDEFSIPELIEDVVTTMSHNLGEDTQFSCIIDPSLSTMRYDKAKFKKFITTLLGNSFKLLGYDSKVQLIAEKLPDEIIKITVSDNSIGYQKQQLDMIFPEFYQLGVVVDEFYNTSGLDLTLIKRIIESHGGEIGVESTFGEGCTYWFTLPLNVYET